MKKGTVTITLECELDTSEGEAEVQRVLTNNLQQLADDRRYNALFRSTLRFRSTKRETNA